jgi:hypothetical protein
MINYLTNVVNECIKKQMVDWDPCGTPEGTSKVMKNV